MPVRERTVTARIGMHLRAIQGDGAHFEHPHRAGELQHLHEQRLDLRQEALSERRDRVVIRMLVPGDEAKGHRVVRGPFDPPAGEHSGCVSINQQAQQHRGVVRGNARSAVSFDHLREVQSIHHFDHKARQVPLRQPFIDRRRKQKWGVAVDRSKVAHGFH